MSAIIARLVARFDRWLDRVVATDDRYICAACDDRFHNRSEGIEHVLRCHPEYQGVVVYDGAPDQESVTEAAPARRPLPASFPATPAPIAIPVGR